MSDLIEALQIFLKYGNPHNPTHCSHDELWICVETGNITDDDNKRLEELDFHYDENDDSWKSFRFGAA